MSERDEKIPVTLLSGFLGSGKTTLLNRLLSESRDERIAVLVNEFGELGIDGSLVVGVDDDIVELANGCICCSILDDLRGAIHKILNRSRRKIFKKAPVDRIVIESSGMASPGPAVQTLFLDPELARSTTLDAVVTLVHAGHLEQQLHSYPEASTQLAYADRVVINHADRVDEASLDRIEALIREINGLAPITRCDHARVSMAFVLAARTRDPDAWKLEVRKPGEKTPPEPHHRAQSISLTSDEPVDIHALKMWLQFVAKSPVHEIMRMKGILRCAQSEEAVVVQAIYQWLELGPYHRPAPETSVLVIIGRDLDRAMLERGWDRCRVGVAG